MSEEKKEQLGWKDVTITTEMGLDTIVNFANILNQRMCTLENLFPVKGDDGKDISLTDYYAHEAAKEAASKDNAETTPADK